MSWSRQRRKAAATDSARDDMVFLFGLNRADMGSRMLDPYEDKKRRAGGRDAVENSLGQAVAACEKMASR